MARAALVAAFAALVTHTMMYAAFLEDPFTWVILGAGLAIAPLAGAWRRPRRLLRAGRRRPLGRQPSRALVLEYVKRLATTGAAYTASSVVAKLIAVALLPLYTRHLTRADYGAAEVLLATVVALSIVVRLGIIEALLRFYYRYEDQSERTEVVAHVVRVPADLEHGGRADRGAVRRARCPSSCSTAATPS